MNRKLSLIRYYYSEMSHVQRYGGAFFKPLFFDYPNDGPEAYSHQVRNVMLGNHLKLGLMSDFGASGISGYPIYFPKGMWCEVFNRQGTKGCTYQSIGGNRLAEAQYPWDFYLHLKQGSIIPFQRQVNGEIKAMNTADLQLVPVTFHILPDCWETNTGGRCVAQGLYFNDDGETVNATNFNRYQFSYDQREIDLSNKTDAPETLTFRLVNKQIGDINNRSGGTINANDWLGGLEIYNAAEWRMTTKYRVTATTDDGETIKLSTATYD